MLSPIPAVRGEQQSDRQLMIVIVDYGAGNLTSVLWAVLDLGHAARISADPRDVARAERVIVPGVGAARAAMDHLRSQHLDTALREAVGAGVPFLGICLGMQILMDRSDEDDGVDTLGLLPGEVHRLQPRDGRSKVPHMGWNRVDWRRPHPVLEGVPRSEYYYFVHSYHVCPARPDDVLGTCEHGGQVFCAAVAHRNVIAVQFHVEKSGPAGLALLSRFLAWDGRESERPSVSPAPGASTDRPPC